MAHKDMYYRKGVVSTCGSKIMKDRKAAATATALERLDAAGAIQFGVLNMAEFAFGPTGHNWHFGHCRNPWDPQRITGGSSSGSGVAVAARASFAALGSDTGGSIRLPAAFCGTSGFKPTYGRVSRAGAMPLSFSLDTVGPLARTVEDCALILQAIAGRRRARSDRGDATGPGLSSRALARPFPGCGSANQGSISTTTAMPRSAARCRPSLEVFRKLGAKVVDDRPSRHERLERRRRADHLGRGGRGARQLAAHAGAGLLAAGAHAPRAGARLSRRRLPRMRCACAASRCRRFCDEVFSKVDVVHAPVVSFQTPTIAETDLGDRPEAAAMLGRTTRLTRPGNFLALPIVSASAGFTRAGMPIGMQLMGRPFDEATVLRAGHAYQQATQWHLRLAEQSSPGQRPFRRPSPASGRSTPSTA